MASSRMAGIVANVVATLALAGTCGAAQPPATAPSSLPAGTTDPASPRGYAEASWPQWRGPNRDGKVVSGPKLLDAWPKDGPKLVWKNGQIPGWPDAGTGSIVVAGDKVFVYMGWAKFTPSKVITAEYMNEWGWAPDMPDDLVKKVEAARVSAERNDAKTPAALDAYIKDFLGKLDADQAKKFGPTISNRLKKGGNAFEWERMVQMAKCIDHEFKTADELREVFANNHYGHSEILQTAMTVLFNRARANVDRIVCLEAATGKELWAKEFSGTVAGMWGGTFMASATPAVSGGKCYAVGSQGMYCLDVKDGAEVWHKTTRFSNSSPMVLGNAVYALATPSDKPVSQMGGSLTAFDAATGRLLWQQTKVSSNWGSSVVAWTSGPKTYLIANGDGGTYCVDPENGSVLWQAPGGMSTTPAISDDLMVVHGGKVRAFKLSPQKADLLWEMPSREDRMGSPLIYQGNVYFEGSGYNGFGCLDAQTGEEKWRQKDEAGGLGAAALADGKLFALFPAKAGQADSTESVRMFRATPEKFQELGRFNPSASLCSSPAISGGRLFLRLRDGVACYDLMAATASAP